MRLALLERHFLKGCFLQDATHCSENGCLNFGSLYTVSRPLVPHTKSHVTSAWVTKVGDQLFSINFFAIAGFTKVREFLSLVKLSEEDGHLQQKLKQLLKLSKEKWEAACEHAKTAVQVSNYYMGIYTTSSRCSARTWAILYTTPFNIEILLSFHHSKRGYGRASSGRTDRASISVKLER